MNKTRAALAVASTAGRWSDGCELALMERRANGANEFAFITAAHKIYSVSSLRPIPSITCRMRLIITSNLVESRDENIVNGDEIVVKWQQTWTVPNPRHLTSRAVGIVYFNAEITNRGTMTFLKLPRRASRTAGKRSSVCQA